MNSQPGADPELNALRGFADPVLSVNGRTGVVVLTSADVGLGGVTNLQGLLDAKVPITRMVNGHALSADVVVSAADVGLGNASNTSDANKPISTAAAAALAAKADLVSGVVPSAQSLIRSVNGYTGSVVLSNTDVGAEVPLTFIGPLTRTVNTISIPVATASVSGYITATDWNRFNTNQASLSFPQSVVSVGNVVTLSGDVAAPGNSYYYGTGASGTKGYFVIPAGLTPGNPSASVGPSAINGTATTYMRSDAAPALANTAVTAGSYGSASQVATFTVDAQGRLTAASTVSIAIASGAVSGLASSATIDTTNAANISTGTFLSARMPAFTGDVTTSAGAVATTLANIPTGVPAAGTIVHTNIAAPASPAAGKVSVYSDSTDLRFHDKNASGVIGTTVVADTGAANNFLTAISAAGVISKARPADSDISFTDITTGDVSITAHGFAPKLPNDATKFLNGNGIWSTSSSGYWDTVIITTVDFITSTVFTITGMIFNVLPATLYELEVMLVGTNSNTANGGKTWISHSGTVAGAYVAACGYMGPSSSGLGGGMIETFNVSPSWWWLDNTAVTNQPKTLIVKGFVLSSTQSGQNISVSMSTNGNGSNITIKKGSVFKIKKMA